MKIDIEDTILVTGGAGFIGSAFVLQWMREVGTRVVNLDLLNYAGNPTNLSSLHGDQRHELVIGDIGDCALVKALFARSRPRAVVHFAAESHVDRSIINPYAFVRTNVEGTQRLLEAALEYSRALKNEDRDRFRFLYVSTDEVYGTLALGEPAFTEEARYAPNSPYAASKAASDHLVRAYYETYKLPVLTTNCSNNYGPRQFPEKLIPLMILNALEWKKLPVYGDGCNVRDWLYVEDHCRAIRAVLERGRVSEVYNIGGASERTNLEVVHAICDGVDRRSPGSAPRRNLISFVADRPGHDRRYAINATKIEHELGWKPLMPFAQGLEATITWYFSNPVWVESVQTRMYHDCMKSNYIEHGVE